MSLTDVPSAEDLRDSSLGLLFSAWSELDRIISDFVQYHDFENEPMLSEDFQRTVPAEDDSEYPYFNELAEYLVQSKMELSLAIVSAFASYEIGIKSKIAKESPLLLIKDDITKIKPTGKISFSDLTTLNTHECINMDAAISSTPIPESTNITARRWGNIRNRIGHIGHVKHDVKLHKIYEFLALIYVTVLNGEDFYGDFAEYLKESRLAYFPGRWEPSDTLTESLNYTIDFHNKNTRELVITNQKIAYECEECSTSGENCRAGVSYKSSYEKDGNVICVICGHANKENIVRV
ncbi:hypothetical protein [Aurantimonas coralicida]|uniref:hypothetical protein n=1 Tax=Aurantimonas coralicida TaxID=182270 RepID=UPI001E4ED33F|nr:hypothetical protein [Aurantimonas coralicida]MCD1642398.1 hypothetical protein [Aurantimonas coralicida]